MGYIVKQLLLSGYESSGGHSLAVVEVDAAADFATLPTYQDGSIGYIKGDPDSLYILDTTWKLVQKSALEAGDQIEIDGVSPYALAMVFKLLQGQLALLTETAATADALDVLTTKGDLLVQGAAAPGALPVGTSNQVLSVTAGMPVWANPADLVFVNDTWPEYVRASLPTSQNTMFEGMLVYNTADHTLKVCKTRGLNEWDTVTVNHAATAAGNVTITLNGVAVNVAVEEGDGIDLVAQKIRAATFSGWTVDPGTDGVISFKKDAAGTCSAPTASGGTTGVTFGSFVRTVEGVDAVWSDLINAS